MGASTGEDLDTKMCDLAQNFDIGTVIDCKLMEGGQVNENYLVQSDTNKYVMTVFNTKKYSEIVDMLASLIDLSEKGFSKCSKIIQTIKNIDFHINDYIVIMKEYIEGDVIEDMDERKLFKVGKILAQLHKIEPRNRAPKEHMYGLEQYNNVKESDGYTSWLKEKESKLYSSIEKGIPKGLIHGDFFWDNIIWFNDKIEGIIDFEEACNYYLIFDIGMAIVGNCIENDRINFEKASELIRGYEYIKKLEFTEKNQLKLFTEYAAIATSFQRYLLKKEGNGGDRLRDYTEMVRIADNIAEMNNDNFMKRIGISHQIF